MKKNVLVLSVVVGILFSGPVAAGGFVDSMTDMISKIKFPPPPPQTPYIAYYEVSLKNDLGIEVLFKVGSSENYIVSPNEVEKLSSAEKNPVVTISKKERPEKCPEKAANEQCWGVVVEDKQTLPNAFIIYLDKEYDDVVVRAIK
jgi:hypothetical protein